MLNRKLSCILIAITLNFKLFALEESEPPTKLRAQLKQLQEKECPAGNHIENRHWVKIKVACMSEMDQFIRNQPRNNQNENEIQQLMKEVDENNTNELKTILNRWGWLTISTFGRKTDANAWLIVQHASHDIEFQAHIAFLLGLLVEEGETRPKNYAYLVDRVALRYQHLGLKQLYGTQYTLKDNKAIPEPYEGTLEELNLRRKKVGLEPLDQYLKFASSYAKG